MGFRKCSETRGFHCSEQAGRCSWRFEASDDDRTTWCLPPQLSGSEDLRKPSETRTNHVRDRQIVRVSDRVFRLTILPSDTMAEDSLETTRAPAWQRTGNPAGGVLSIPWTSPWAYAFFQILHDLCGDAAVYVFSFGGVLHCLLLLQNKFFLRENPRRF
jgi:hypothetical protein